jgi:hypothetical protein
MVECDTVNISVPEDEQDVDMQTTTCGVPDGLEELSPGDTFQATVGVVNNGSDTGSADVVVNAVPSGVDPTENPGEVVEIGRQSSVVLPGQSSDVAIFDVTVPEIGNVQNLY